MIEFDEYKERFVEFADSPLGEGGQKIVYRALHAEYGEVVVKVLRREDERSKREIDIVRKYNFDSVPTIFSEDQVLFEGLETKAIVEEYVKGENAREIISSGRHFTLSEAVDFLEKSLRFLEQISDQGIVHRDIKPDNIIIADGNPVFLDFGIARILGAKSLTRTGAMGPNTPGYAAPEQFSGLKDKIDGRADLFSIGVVTYELVSGENPFTKDAATAYDVYHNTMTITPMSYSIPGDREQQFMGLLSSLMSRSISARPRDARQALRWLESAKGTFEEGWDS